MEVFCEFIIMSGNIHIYGKDHMVGLFFTEFTFTFKDSTVRATCGDQSVRPSVCLRYLVQCTPSFSRAQHSLNFTHSLPLGKGFSVTLNHISGLKVKVTTVWYLKKPCPEHIPYPLSPTCVILHTQSDFGQGVFSI